MEEEGKADKGDFSDKDKSIEEEAKEEVKP